MSLYLVQRQVEALKRRLPIHYNLALLRPYAEQFCYDWQYCVSLGYEPPSFESLPCISAYPPRKHKAKPLMDRIKGLGVGSLDLVGVRRYVDRCRGDKIYPHPDNILRVALPHAACLELIPPSPHPISYAEPAGSSR